MFEMVYESRVRERLTFGQITGLIMAARQRNAELGVTGLLLFDGEHFVQLLEGPEAAVQSIYRSINRDPRHTHISHYWGQTVARRSFEGFDLACAIADEPGGHVSVPDLLVERDTHERQSSFGMRLLRVLYQQRILARQNTALPLAG